MNRTSQKRRTIIKGVLATGIIGTAMGTRLVYPYSASKSVWPKAAFNARSIEEAILKLTGSNTAIPNPDDILIKTPTIAENGIAHITIHSRLPNTESIAIFIPNNVTPLVAHFKLNQKTINTITTRIKIESTGDIIIFVKANNKLYSASKKMHLTKGK